jgi:hypothetical protein
MEIISSFDLSTLTLNRQSVGWFCLFYIVDEFDFAGMSI